MVLPVDSNWLHIFIFLLSMQSAVCSESGVVPYLFWEFILSLSEINYTSQ